MAIIKIVLILAVTALVLLLLRSHGTNKGGAYVKIGMVVFLAFAAYAVVRPEDVTWVATQLGVGRGTDLVLYLLVVGFGFFSISTYLRFKEIELKLARLARAIALADADRRDDSVSHGRRAELDLSAGQISTEEVRATRQDAADGVLSREDHESNQQSF